MNLQTSKLVSRIALALALAMTFLFHFSYLDWGLPSTRKTLQVMGSPEQIQRWVPKMIEQRNQYYALFNRLLDKSQPFKENYDQMSQRWNIPVFQILPNDIVLDRTRNYLIGVNVSDEQYTMAALSALNPKKLQFALSPQAYYGGFYYYTSAGFLVLAKLAGKISLNSNVAYYFTHPEETKEMYRWIRAVGGVSVVATVLVLFGMMSRWSNASSAALSVLIFSVFPLMVPLSHLAKAHLYGMFWITCGLSCCWRILESQDEPEDSPALRRLYLGAGVSLGLCAGTLITNLTTGSLLFFTESLRQNWQWRNIVKSKNFWISAALFLATFCLTNFYIFLHFSQFQRPSQQRMTIFSFFDQAGINETNRSGRTDP